MLILHFSHLLSSNTHSFHLKDEYLTINYILIEVKLLDFSSTEIAVSLKTQNKTNETLKATVEVFSSSSYLMKY